MDEVKFLIPKKGLLVRNPVTRDILPAEGAQVEWTGKQGNYWRRRVMCGDCFIRKEQKTVMKVNKKDKE